jgi:probable HAF family extracellular repeat protein
MQASRSILLAAFALTLCFHLGSQALAQDLSMQLVAPEKGWALGDGRLFWTEDDGGHWTDITPLNARFVLADVFFLDVSHGWALVRTAVGENEVWAFDLATTSDSGQTWSIAHVNIQRQVTDWLSGDGWLDFVDGVHGWIVLRGKSSSAFSRGLLLRTDDGGTSWKQFDAPLASRPRFADAKNGWLVGGAGEIDFYHTRDGGESWQPNWPEAPKSTSGLDNIAYHVPPQFTDEKHGFLPAILSPTKYTNDPERWALVLFSTDDAGKTWKPDRVLAGLGRQPTGVTIAADLFEPVLVAVPISDGKHLDIVAVNPGGKSSRTSADVVRGDDMAFELSFVGAARGWVRTQRGNLLSTSDGGTTWQAIPPTQVPAPLPPLAAPRVKLRKLWQSESLPSAASGSQVYVAPHMGFHRDNVASVIDMTAWWNASPFFDVGFYVGGENYCYRRRKDGTCVRKDPNLDLSWVTDMQNQVWGLMPIWVGLQAPCIPGGKKKFNLINPAKAQQQGMDDAKNAAGAMSALGLTGTVIFYDMEFYQPDGGTCSTAVQQFLTGWVKGMTANGFQTTGVYGNPAPAQQDFSRVSPAINEVWIAATPAKGQSPRVTIWGLGTLCDIYSNPPCDLWKTDQRAHHFLADVPNVTYGGVHSNLKIDYNIVDLQIPGGNGHKTYSFAPGDSIAIQNASYNQASGINDVVVGTFGPSFINNGQVGQVAGYWQGPCGRGCEADEGFLDQAGNITFINDTHAPPDATIVWSINNSTVVVGYSYVGVGNYPGFVGSPGGSFTDFMPQGASFTYPEGINDNGQTVGYYYDAKGVPHSFLYQKGKNAIQFDPHCTGEATAAVYGINGYGQMVGSYSDQNGVFHGFLYSNGQCGLFPPPLNGTNVSAQGINNNGQAVGSYIDKNGLESGFLYDGVAFYTFAYKDGIYNSAFGINDAAQIVGTYNTSSFCPSNTVCGFVLNPE